MHQTEQDHYFSTTSIVDPKLFDTITFVPGVSPDFTMENIGADQQQHQQDMYNFTKDLWPIFPSSSSSSSLSPYPCHVHPQTVNSSSGHSHNNILNNTSIPLYTVVDEDFIGTNSYGAQEAFLFGFPENLGMGFQESRFGQQQQQQQQQQHPFPHSLEQPIVISDGKLFALHGHQLNTELPQNQQQQQQLQQLGPQHDQQVPPMPVVSTPGVASFIQNIATNPNENIATNPNGKKRGRALINYAGDAEEAARRR